VRLDEDLKEIEIGRAECLRDGADAALVAFGVMVKPALEAAEILEAEGVEVAVVNARFAKPLDTALIGDLARRTRRIVTLEEHSRMGGFGSAVLEAIAELGLTDVRVRVLGIGDEFIDHGTVEQYHEQFGLRPAQIAQTVRDMMGPTG